jgi:hypothetical protein
MKKLLLFYFILFSLNTMVEFIGKSPFTHIWTWTCEVVLLLVTQSDSIFNIGNTILYYIMGLFNQASNHQHHL